MSQMFTFTTPEVQSEVKLFCRRGEKFSCRSNQEEQKSFIREHICVFIGRGMNTHTWTHTGTHTSGCCLWNMLISWTSVSSVRPLIGWVVLQLLLVAARRTYSPTWAEDDEEEVKDEEEESGRLVQSCFSIVKETDCSCTNEFSINTVWSFRSAGDRRETKVTVFTFSFNFLFLLINVFISTLFVMVFTLHFA